MIGAGHYHAVGYPFGPSLATGQVLGGGIIWILGDSVGLPFLAVQLIQMMRADKQEAEQIDAELDARDAARAARAAARAEDDSARAAGLGSESASGLSGDPVTGDSDPGRAAVPVGSPAGETDESGEDDADRPWWENDPRITDRYRRA
jgi:hypothetical protein